MCELINWLLPTAVNFCPILFVTDASPELTREAENSTLDKSSGDPIQ